MAAREGQGLQIAVIVFACLTIVLAVTTFMFYAQSASASKERDAAKKQLQDEQLTNNKLLYRVLAMKYVLGLPGVTMQEVEVQKGRAGGDDPEVKEILDKFNADMAAIGDQAAPGEAKNYGTLAKILMATLNAKNASVATAVEESRKSQLDREATAKRELERANAAELLISTAKTRYDEELDKFNQDRAKMQEANQKIAADLGVKDQKAKTELETVAKQRDDAQAGFKRALETIKVLERRLEECEQKKRIAEFDKPDGRIVTVNQKQRLVWIDLGYADGLQRQMTFSVYDRNTSNVAAETPKARIEVVQITGDRLAEARILEDKISDLIQPGDVIFNPAWSPGQRVHFALSGRMDINGDRIDDYELIRNVILLNGGIIDAELRPDGTRTGSMSVNTRYMVVGDPPTDDSKNPSALKNFSDMENERMQNGVQKISPKDLLAMMGWKADERTISLSGSSGGAFRTRGQPRVPGTPGKTEAPPAGAPAGAETPGPAAPTPASDPFSTPAAGTPSRPSGDVDPFATPM